MYNQFFRFIARPNLSKHPVTFRLYYLSLMTTAITTIGNSKQDASSPRGSSNLSFFSSALTNERATDETYPKDLAFKVASHPW